MSDGQWDLAVRSEIGRWRNILSMKDAERVGERTGQIDRFKPRVTTTKGYLSGLLSKASEECSESQYLAGWLTRRFGAMLQCSFG